MLSNVYLALLNKVGKLGLHPPKARSACQEWQTENKEEASKVVKDLWEIEVNAGRQRIPAREAFAPSFARRRS